MKFRPLHDRVLVRRVELPGGGPPEIRVEAIIDAAPALVWPVIEDCGRYRHTMPRITASEELSFKDVKLPDGMFLPDYDSVEGFLI